MGDAGERRQSDVVVSELHNLLRERMGWPGNEVSLREVDRRLRRSANYTSRLLAGRQRLRVDQVVALLRAAEIDASEFFAELSRRVAAETRAAKSERPRNGSGHVQVSAKSERQPSTLPPGEVSELVIGLRTALVRVSTELTDVRQRLEALEDERFPAGRAGNGGGRAG